jgi:hypothetical protein
MPAMTVPRQALDKAARQEAFERRKITGQAFHRMFPVVGPVPASFASCTGIDEGTMQRVRGESKKSASG